MFVAAADLHLRDKTPKYRKDDFRTNQFLKFDQLLEYTVKETNSNILVLAGDVFDSKGVNYATVVKAMGLIMMYNVEILLVPGQHDLRYHRNGLEGTPLGVLLQLENVHLLNPELPYKSPQFPSISFSGAGWNETPNVKTDVLVMHKMVTEKGPLWPDQVDYTTGKALLKKYKDYPYIITGDNHRPHKTRFQQRVNINCGSMCRTGKDQYKYKPAFWHVKERGVSKIPYEILKASKAFDSERIVRDEKFEENKKKFQAMTDNISNKAPKPDFERVLNNVITEASPSIAALGLINKKMEELNGS